MRAQLVAVFILLYLLYAWLGSAPKGYHLGGLGRCLSRGLVWLGLVHSWNMFIGPLRSLRHLEARITLSQGEVRTWYAPRVGEGGVYRSFLAMRHRKYQNNIFNSTSGVPKQALVRHLWRRYESGGMSPTQIDLYMEESRVPPAEDPRDSRNCTKRQFLIYSWNIKLGLP